MSINKKKRKKVVPESEWASTTKRVKSTPKGGLPKTEAEIEKIKQAKRAKKVAKVKRQRARKAAARKAERANRDASSKNTVDKKPSESNVTKSTEKVKKKTGWSRHLVFVGQLPFDATEEQIRAQFRDGGAGELKSVRMIREKHILGKDGKGKFRGIAFIELDSGMQQARALRLHHSRFGEFTSGRKTGRIINVERTCGGGGSGENRRGKLASLRDEQGKHLLKEVESLIKEVIEKKKAAEVSAEKPDSTVNDENGYTEPKVELGEGDIDNAVREALATFPRDVAKQLLEEFVDTVTNTVTNRSAWFMGILRRYRSHMAEGREVSDLRGGDLGPNSGLCRAFLDGFCKFGDDCKFAHRGGGGGGYEKKKHAKKIIEKEVCFAFQRGTCTRGDDCKFAHVQGRIGVCKAHLEGRCTRGASCIFSHDSSETICPKIKDKKEEVQSLREFNRGCW